MKTHLLALLQDNCLDLVPCAFLHKFHSCSLLCIYKYCFYGPDQPKLTDAGRGKACLIFKQEHGAQKVIICTDDQL